MDLIKLEKTEYYISKTKKSIGFSEFNAVYAAEVEQLDVGKRYDAKLLQKIRIYICFWQCGVPTITKLSLKKSTFIGNFLIFHLEGVITKGRVSDQPINGVDFMPTFAEISGVDIDEDKFDGESFVPLIWGKDYRRKKPMFFHFLYRR